MAQKTKSNRSNSGRLKGQKKPFTVEQVRTLRSLLQAEKMKRELTMLNVGIDTMLRSSDLVRLRIADIRDAAGRWREEFTVRMVKTNRNVTVILTRASVEALEDYAGHQPQTDWLFPSPRRNWEHLSERQHQNIVKDWCRMLRLDPQEYNTHSVRRTKASWVYADTQNPEIARQLLGHSDLRTTHRYLGVQEKEALDISRKYEI